VEALTFSQGNGKRSVAAVQAIAKQGFSYGFALGFSSIPSAEGASQASPVPSAVWGPLSPLIDIEFCAQSLNTRTHLMY
jgi:hypothetical protein